MWVPTLTTLKGLFVGVPFFWQLQQKRRKISFSRTKRSLEEKFFLLWCFFSKLSQIWKNDIIQILLPYPHFASKTKRNNFGKLMQPQHATFFPDLLWTVIIFCISRNHKERSLENIVIISVKQILIIWVFVQSSNLRGWPCQCSCLGKAHLNSYSCALLWTVFWLL